MTTKDLLNPLELLSRINRRLRHLEYLFGIRGESLQVYTDNTAAKNAGKEIGEFYKTSDGTIKQVQ